MIVYFSPDKKRHYAEKGENLMEVAFKAKVAIEHMCTGAGACKKCKVQITSGGILPPDDIERKALSREEIKNGYRLACRVNIEDDLHVTILKTETAASRKAEILNFPSCLPTTRHIKKYFIKILRNASTKHQSDEENILQELKKHLKIGANGISKDVSKTPIQLFTINSRTLKSIPEIFKDKNCDITLTIRENEIIAIEKGDTSKKNYGIAFDIGTTTIVGMLWDTYDGRLIGLKALSNPQQAYGADVISRINCAVDSAKLNDMQTITQASLNEIAEYFIHTYQIPDSEIYEATVVGNTTMSHLLLGIAPASLAKAPYAPVFVLPINTDAEQMNLGINPLANVHILPNIAGHVGSDIVGVLLASKINEMKGLSLAIDIGTNGEIVVAMNGRVLACSTAAGPAFEGASICHGMRAAAGAIEEVSIKDDVLIETIDNQTPIGICGSGLIDAIAQMLDVGLINSMGRLIDIEKAKAKNIPDRICTRLRDGDQGHEFVVAWGNGKKDIVITQKDIREVQLAKGAIFAGINILLEMLDSTFVDIDRIMLAGAFGNYIKKYSALRIGLLPDILEDKIISIGNGAGIGSSIALLSLEQRNSAEICARKVEYVDLAGRAAFQDLYLQAMPFPQFKTRDEAQV